MKYFKYTLFTLLRLPAAWICGVRLTHLDDQAQQRASNTDGLIKIHIVQCFGPYRDGSRISYWDSFDKRD